MNLKYKCGRVFTKHHNRFEGSRVLEQDRYALKTTRKRHRSNSFYSDFSYESSGPELKTEFFTFQTIHLTYKNH